MNFRYFILAFLTCATIANLLVAKNHSGNENWHSIDTFKEAFCYGEYCSTIQIQKLFLRIETLYFLQLAVYHIHRKHVKTQLINLVFRREAVVIAFQDLDIQGKDVMRIKKVSLLTWRFTDVEAQKDKIKRH